METERDADSRLQHARVMFERSIGHARQAAINVKGMLGHSCKEAAQLLREQVATVPYVRFRQSGCRQPHILHLALW